ncbi:hypothetical protein [Actinopolymorpha pittospori]|uniref:Polymorphic outer membrane protein repeat-containing protein n=1 Tax=Actinopolymorpha pittospori TaxID=648752 RepID=A0A927MYF3_9ACTN|nr:hypothetical protein [Actinopolymorpha pittospori]MBE1607018.1 hypothetical protein [Actinopolymorpha pittospori]
MDDASKDGDKKKDDKGRDGKKVKEVGCDPDELIAALVRANADKGAKLELEAKCTYTLTAFQDDNGLPVIVQPVSIEGNGATIVRAANAERFRIFSVGVGGNLKLRDVTVKGGDAPAEFGGGGLLVQQGGRATIQDSTFTLNRTDGSGGAIANFGNTRITGDAKDGDKDGKDGKDWTSSTQIRNNSATADAGGVYSAGHLSVEGSSVSYNNAGVFGGGLENDGGVMNVTSTRVDHNTAVDDAGGIDVEIGSVTKVTHSWVTDNTSGEVAGGIGNFGGTLYVKHTDVSHNWAATSAGGVGNFGGGQAVVEDSKINENTATELGGGVDNFGLGEISEFVLRRSEVNRNRAVSPASQGGGVANTGDTTFSIVDSRITENLATTPPGGVFTGNPITVDDESVIIKNRPTNCDGVVVEVPNCFG